MDALDNGVGRQLAAWPCLLCHGLDADIEDRYLAIQDGCVPSRRSLVEKAITVRSLTDELFSGTALADWRTSDDINRVVAARQLEEMVLSTLATSTSRRIREDGARLRRARVTQSN